MRALIILFNIVIALPINGQGISSLAKNLDFSDGTENWEIPGDFPMRIVEDLKGSKSKNSVIIENTSEQSVPYFTQELHLPSHKLSKLEIKGRVMAETVDSSAEISMFAFTKQDGKWVAYKAGEKLDLKTSEEWVEITAEIWVYERANQLAFGLYLGGKGSLSIDCIQVNELMEADCTNISHRSFQEESLSIILEQSLYKDDLDSMTLAKKWDLFRGCDTSKQTLDATLDMVLKTIDSHSFFMNSETTNNWSSSADDPESSMIFTSGRILDSTIAYLSVPHVASGDSAMLVKFADSLQNLIEDLDHPKLEGWVVDLRNNGGGNCWPMLAGIGPILGEGISGYFGLDTSFQAWIYEDGQASMDELVMTKVSRKPYLPFKQDPKVAVLVSDQTGSSGEILALAFKNRDDSLLFGSKTARYTTTNSTFKMSDGSQIFLATSYYYDRKKNPYPDGVAPDILITSTSEGDPALDTATEWLKKN